MPTTTAKNTPAKTIPLTNLKAAIWRNANEKGPKFSVTFERIYKDVEEWKSSHSYTRDDLLVLAKLIATLALRRPEVFSRN